jgi:hypothetical protein
MAHQEPAAHLNIPLYTHMEDIQSFEGNQYGFMIANGISFDPDLLANGKWPNFQLSAKCCPKIGMA